MEVIITKLKDVNNKEIFEMDAKNAKIKHLEFRNKQLEEENKLLLAMLAEALEGRTIVIREETLERKPRFIIGENLGGDVIISCR